MSARLAEQTVLDTRAAVAAYLASHSGAHAGRVLGVDPSVVSRAVTAAYDGQLDHGSRWTAAQMVALARDDDAVMGAIIAAKVAGRASASETLATISALLSSAQRATDAMSATSPGGASIVASERQDLALVYLRTIAQLARAVQLLQGETRP